MLQEFDLIVGQQELIKKFPYYANVLRKMRFIPVKGLGTTSCDDKFKVYYDPALALEQINIQQLLYHELMHLLRGHHKRGQVLQEKMQQDYARDVDPATWNIACDCEINDDHPLGMPKQYDVLPRNYDLSDGCTAEAYYDALFHGPDRGAGRGADKHKKAKEQRELREDKQREKNEGKGKKGDGKPEKGQGKPDSKEGKGKPDEKGEKGEPGGRQGQGQDKSDSGQGQPDPSSPLESPPSENGQGQSQQSDGQSSEGVGSGAGGQGKGKKPRVNNSIKFGDCGSCADGIKRPWEVDDPQDLSDSEVEQALERTAQEMLENPNITRQEREMAQGIIDGAWTPGERAARKWSSEIQLEIMRHLRNRGIGYARPSRRDNPDFILPGRTNTPPKITFAVDVSGSIGDTAAKKAFSLIDEFRGWQIDFKVVAFNTRAWTCEPGVAYRFGGGTNLPAAFELITTEHRDTELVIIISDGQTGYSKAPCDAVMFTWSRKAPAEYGIRNVVMPHLA